MDDTIKEIYEGFGELKEKCKKIEDEDLRLQCSLHVLGSRDRFISDVFKRRTKRR